MVTVDTKLISLLGYPLKQTFAPQMFNETFKKLNMDYFYFPIEIENDKLEAVVNGIRCMNYAGFNVTKPNKIKILEYLDELDELADKIGSVNVVVIKGGKLKGYNTDGIGFVQALLDETGMDLGQNTFFIFGAGGASRALSATLAYQGVKRLYIIDKIDQASTSLVDDINRKIRECAEFIAFDNAPVRQLLLKSNVLVNASGVGMYPHLENTPVDKKFLYKDLFVYDITYNPLKTRLLLDAEEAGCKTMNGIGMVINQGIKGFTLMTGMPEPTEIMKAAMYDIISEPKKG
ncbi:MAG: shikimate dehydrogenase [Desulfobacteraceae bacterium]|nr:MAG: shikimate dehydrogenase [Desulfobacteraceae bacterium]